MSYGCRECSKKFRTEAGFDFHRTGKHGVKHGPNRRRCMSDDELIAAGFILMNGLWSRPLSKNAAARLGVERIRPISNLPATILPGQTKSFLNARTPHLSFIVGAW